MGPRAGRLRDKFRGRFYELAERPGLGASYRFEAAAAGTYTLGASLFTIDTTFPSDSAFSKRGRMRVEDGGAGNIEALDSVAVTLDGEAIPKPEGFPFNLGYRHLEAGAGGVADYVAGVM